jgi:hypothetical protein
VNEERRTSGHAATTAELLRFAVESSVDHQVRDQTIARQTIADAAVKSISDSRRDDCADEFATAVARLHGFSHGA